MFRRKNINCVKYIFIILFQLTLINLIHAQYTGGSNDGYSFSSVTNQNPLQNIYTGGSNDGFSLSSAVNQNPLTSIYIGGSNDGFSLSAITNQNPLSSIYTGGSNDGFSLSSIDNQNPLPDIYTGGGNDGFALSTAINLNPLALLELTVAVHWKNDDAELTWRGVEINHDYYSIQRSPDGNQFTEIGRVNGARSQFPLDSSYHFLDVNAAGINTPVIYYRLKLVDINGKTDYSPVLVLRKTGAGIQWLLYAYPNPVSDFITLKIGKAPVSNPSVRAVLFNANGTALQSIIIKDRANIPVKHLPAGTYFLHLHDGSVVIQTIKIFVIH
jgi:hypothetical protein